MPSAPAQRAIAVPNDLEAYWIPFTPNRAFKAAPRLIVRAKDMHYYTPEGRGVLDGTAGMWCTNAGHNRDPIVAAIQAEAAELDYAPAFQFSHPKAFELASRVAALAPGDLDHVFFCNSGSEAVDTALKIALAYHNVRGEAARTRLIGRERGYQQPQTLRRDAGGGRSSADDLQPRAPSLQQRRARVGRASRRRARAHRHAA
jgi:beta-alanine--pyruvate transaminase